MKKLAFLAALTAVLPAKAEVLTFNFTGAVQIMEVNREKVTSSALNGTPISLGHTIKGSFSYDTKMPASSSYPWEVSYSHWQDIIHNSLTFSINQTGFNFDQQPYDYSKPSIQYQRDSNSQVSMHARAYRYSSKEGWNENFSVIFTSPRNSSLALNPNMLASVLPTSFLNGNFRYLHTNDSTIWTTGTQSTLLVKGAITSIALVPAQPVPEPSTYAMLLAGLAGVYYAARRRARS